VNMHQFKAWDTPRHSFISFVLCISKLFSLVTQSNSNKRRRRRRRRSRSRTI